MPIPPRPIPSRRPGHSVPHKPKSTLSPTSANTLDWRAEVAFLDSYAASRKAQAFSMPTTAGVAIMHAATKDREVAHGQPGSVGDMSGTQSKGAREVGLEELILDGKGKREKRATTAATLGFDFIHTPSVLVLPDTEPTSPLSPASAKRGLSIILPGRSTPTSLASTPKTPGLLASSAPKAASRSSGEEEDDEELDEWEHVQLLDGTDREAEDMILGELELDMDGLDVVDKKEAVGMRRIEGLSYAAALGPR